ncbi:restriction endonuclease subunit M [Prevotella sp. PINT]|jgi:hypothetical protein|uniref:restriction endonuclease subunit M n=1 Tax=Palleniella intestinalis TaxID=2736291 RepID=UPI0015548559|nr:restriction endonuclease subunit M [Palleniella intestinalis]NPD82903.1 restriction endonuclease subunit M [Palleniella intestinalis]
MEDNLLQDCHSVDLSEDILNAVDGEVLAILLRDHTTGRNITWATRDYEYLGKGYMYGDEILPERITGKNNRIIVPRVLKPRSSQAQRAKEMAEVFTPSWVCNAQNNLIDEAWFGRKNVFNTEMTTEAGVRTWIPTDSPVSVFPEGKTWKAYVRDTRMEITCGEAPYLVSRYDATTGEPIPINKRIGLLDRKLRLVSENTETSGEWLSFAQEAFQNIYGYEWQGDNLLLARENLLVSFIEYYAAKFGKLPMTKSTAYIAYIVSWNLWQMDGLKGVVPDSCHEQVTTDLFGGETRTPCLGCKDGNLRRHNGTYCLIRDWRAKKEKQKIRFVDLIK